MCNDQKTVFPTMDPECAKVDLHVQFFGNSQFYAIKSNAEPHKCLQIGTKFGWSGDLKIGCFLKSKCSIAHLILVKSQFEQSVLSILILFSAFPRKPHFSINKKRHFSLNSLPNSYDNFAFPAPYSTKHVFGQTKWNFFNKSAIAYCWIKCFRATLPAVANSRAFLTNDNILASKEFHYFCLKEEKELKYSMAIKLITQHKLLSLDVIENTSSPYYHY
uniref:Uncharacterized protein n=1 Tax=Romanomermis culicivorax TaxID=13658 RepID=A0A915K6X2_ROMCU